MNDQETKQKEPTSAHEGVSGSGASPGYAADRVALELAEILIEGMLEFRDIDDKKADEVSLYVRDTIRDNLPKAVRHLTMENTAMASALAVRDSYDRGDLAVAAVALKNRVDELETEQKLLDERLYRMGYKYEEIVCAVWQCPKEEMDEHRHADTLQEANRQAMELARIRLGTK